jgi:anti-anti-sigma factor
MTISKTEENGKLTLALDGMLNTDTAPQLQEILLSALDEMKEIALNFSKLVYMSSAGLRVLLMEQKKTKEKGASMTVVHVSQEIMEVFDMTGFSDILNIRQEGETYDE